MGFVQVENPLFPHIFPLTLFHKQKRRGRWTQKRGSKPLKTT